MQTLLEERVATLSRIAADLVLDLPMEDTLNALAASVVSASTAVSCLIVLFDEETDEIRLAGSYGVSDIYDKAANTSTHREAIRTHKPVLFSNAHQTVPDNLPWERAYVVPFLSRGKALGAIDFAYPPGQDPGEEEKIFLGAVADQAAVAVENARLLSDTRGKAALEERQKLARELHDSVSQALYGIALGVETTREVLPENPERAAEPLDYAVSLAEAGMTEMRPHLRATPGVAREGETRGRAREASRRHPGATRHTGRERDRRRIRCAPGCKGVPLPRRPGSFAQYRQARPRNQREDKTGTRQGGITLQISDDGVGFDANDDFPGHLGLKSMRERASRQGGTLEITSGPAKSVRIFAHIPV